MNSNKSDEKDFDILLEETSSSKKFKSYQIALLVLALIFILLGIFFKIWIGILAILILMGIIRTAFGFGGNKNEKYPTRRSRFNKDDDEED